MRYLLSWTKYCDSQFCIFGCSILDNPGWRGVLVWGGVQEKMMTDAAILSLNPNLMVLQ